MQLDNETGLALVAPDGTAVANGKMPPELVRGATGQPTEIPVGGHTYQVQSFPVVGLDGKTQIASVVMARPLDRMPTLFPVARLVFALTMLLALLLFAFTTWRARMITVGRV